MPISARYIEQQEEKKIRGEKVEVYYFGNQIGFPLENKDIEEIIKIIGDKKDITKVMLTETTEIISPDSYEKLYNFLQEKCSEVLEINKCIVTKNILHE